MIFLVCQKALFWEFFFEISVSWDWAWVFSKMLKKQACIIRSMVPYSLHEKACVASETFIILLSKPKSVSKWVNLLLNIFAGNFREPSPPPPSVVTPPKKTRAKRPLVVNRRQHSRGKKFPAFDTDKFLSKMKKNRAKKPTLPPTPHSPVPSFMLNNNRPYSRSGH